MSTKKQVKINEQTIRIKIAGFDHKLVDRAVKEVLETAKKSGANTRGPVPLPVDIERHTLLISPHVNKDARDQLEIRTHKRLLDIIEPTKKTVDSLMSLALPGGVNIEIKVS